MRFSRVHVRSSINHISGRSTRANHFLVMVRNWRLFLCAQLVRGIINATTSASFLRRRAGTPGAGGVGAETRRDRDGPGPRAGHLLGRAAQDAHDGWPPQLCPLRLPGGAPCIAPAQRRTASEACEQDKRKSGYLGRSNLDGLNARLTTVILMLSVKTLWKCFNSKS